MEPEDAARRLGRVEEVLGRPVAEMAAGAVEQRASFVAFYQDNRDRLAGALALTLGDSHLGLRRRGRRPVVEERSEDPGSSSEPTVTAALAELPVGQRSFIVYRFYLGLPVAETATALQIRPGTVKSRLSRGLQHLQVRLAHLRIEEHP